MPIVILQTDPDTGLPILWEVYSTGPSVQGADPGKDPHAWTALCEIHAPSEERDGYGGTITTYEVTQYDVPALFKGYSRVQEKTVNGAIRTSEIWSQVAFPPDTEIKATYRVFADGQFYEVLDTAGAHEFSNSDTVIATLARVGPNDENDV